MFSLLLLIIYLAFVSLGLPDSLLGSAWPVVRQEFGAPLELAGVISMIIASGTIVSSLLSDRLTRRFGAGLVTAVSVAMTAVSLLGFGLASALWQICLWAIPYGLGAGAVDAALNNYVALHYTSRHMSWLHCSWGIGCSISPYIMAASLPTAAGWRGGFRHVSYLQIGLAVILFLSLSLWRRNRVVAEDGTETKAKPLGISGALKIKGVPQILLAFFGYCAAETTAGLWASSYLVEARGIDVQTAARFASLFYIGITVGRFLNGFIADKLGDRQMIRIGLGIMLLGVLCILLPLGIDVVPLAGLIIFGLGCAPVYPSIIHSTPENFGAENSQAIIGIQMASAYTGTMVMPPLFGWIASHVTIGLYPVYLALLAALMLVMTERLNRITANNKQNL